MALDPREEHEISQVIQHIGGAAKAKELCKLAAQPSAFGNSQKALDALGKLVGGANRPPGAFPILEAATPPAGDPPNPADLSLPSRPKIP
jgi:hypothetical protein